MYLFWPLTEHLRLHGFTAMTLFVINFNCLNELMKEIDNGCISVETGADMG